MTTVLCFGDSNTWGTSTDGVSRYDETERWTGQLAVLLGKNHTLIEAGQPNRTLVKDFPFDGEKSGITYLKSYLVKYEPELVVIMLGTNDLKKRFDLSSDTISNVMGVLVEKVMAFSTNTEELGSQASFQSSFENSFQTSTKQKTRVLIISPPPIFEVGSYVRIYADAAIKSKFLAGCYAKEAARLGCDFFDAGSVVTSCKVEGIHWGKEQHLLFSQTIYRKIISILNL
jgi:lysophospholipase L1-like esterase